MELSVGFEPTIKELQSNALPIWLWEQVWRQVRDSNPECLSTQRFSRPPDYQLSQPAVLNLILAEKKGFEPLEP